MQLGFGSGVLFATQLTDNTGAAISNPTPARLGVLQEGTLNIASTIKELFGTDQFPVAVGRGTGKVTITAKAARIQANAWNTCYFGLPSGPGTTKTDVIVDESGTVPGSLSYTVQVANHATYKADLGVFYSTTGQQLTRVAAGSEATGKYSVAPATGTYTFVVGDANAVLLFSYTYTKPGLQIAMVNTLLGYAPTFSADFYIPYMGKSLLIHAYQCISDKFNLGSKLEDFIIPDFSASCFADASGKVLDINTDE